MRLPLSSTGAYRPKGERRALQAAMFATGCAGLVAEFVLSTLATYLIGNAILQWTLVMSIMLFAMGVGSRFSRWFGKDLLDTFILIEFTLSILCAVSAVLAYGAAAFTSYTALVIYVHGFLIGCLIGLEIPIVTRINGVYEELRTNISQVMEKDYYGSLAGGLIFAFVALPRLGLTYTPIILGGVNFLVAAFLLWRYFRLLARPKLLTAAFSITFAFLVSLLLFAEPVIRYGEQKKYKDKVIYQAQSVYQKIVMTRWKEYYWLFINGQEQFATFDEEKYHEPLVHPAMKLSADPRHVLILGGGDGLALREVLKHEAVESVTLVDLDPVMTDLATNHPVLKEINRGAMKDPRVRVVNTDAARFFRETRKLFGVAIVDLPDPDTIDLMHVYSLDFYASVKRHLTRGGVMVCQATSPYFSRDAFLCIGKTVSAAGFSVFSYHNQIPTMGEWGWVLGVSDDAASPERLKEIILSIDFTGLETRFLDNDAMISMAHFGKGVFDPNRLSEIKVNTELNPALYGYYLSGSWGMY